jgi:hypothetical protein
LQCLSQNRRFDPYGTSGNLHDNAVWPSTQPDRERCTDNTLSSDNRYLHTSAVAGEYDHRRHSIIQEVCEFELGTRFVENVTLRQIYGFKMFSKQVVFGIGDRLQN